MVMNQSEKLTAAVIGVRGMGLRQAQILHQHEHFELVAVCDLNAEVAHEAAAQSGHPQVFTDFAELLHQVRPDIVAICTNNATHARLTIQAAEAGVRGIYCEKPMAINMSEAREMVEACRSRDTPLIINHQRRLGADLVAARNLIESGAIGDLVELRGANAGDMLSDGTHAIDSLMWLAGDPKPLWVLGQLHRDTEDRHWEKRTKINGEPGFRYGHAVENGTIAQVGLEKKLRLHLRTGEFAAGTVYQEYEIVGTGGRLWRTGDRRGSELNLFIQDGKPGTHHVYFHPDLGKHEIIPAAHDEPALWRPVDLPEGPGVVNLIGHGFTLFYETVLHGTPHPMHADIALRGFEINMAIYESARLGRRIDLPLHQDRFPLELKLEQDLEEQEQRRRESEPAFS